MARSGIVEMWKRWTDAAGPHAFMDSSRAQGHHATIGAAADGRMIDCHRQPSPVSTLSVPCAFVTLREGASQIAQLTAEEGDGNRAGHQSRAAHDNQLRPEAGDREAGGGQGDGQSSEVAKGKDPEDTSE